VPCGHSHICMVLVLRTRAGPLRSEHVSVSAGPVGDRAALTPPRDVPATVAGAWDGSD
jgi:hypothetical protein